jgi:hypothetical protein
MGVGVESKLGPVGHFWPIVPAPGDCVNGEFSGIKIGSGNRSARRKPTPAPLCPTQIPLDQTRARTRAAAVGIQRLIAWAMARPYTAQSKSVVKGLCYVRAGRRAKFWELLCNILILPDSQNREVPIHTDRMR